MNAATWGELTSLLHDHPAEWSIVISSTEPSSRPDFAFHPDRVLKSASTAKMLLLMAVASQITNGTLDPSKRIDRRSLEPVTDSGVWWHLDQDDFSVIDLARLTGMASDNLATNALLEVAGGVEAVMSVAEDFGASGVELHDSVRDLRTADHAETLSSGSSRGYLDLQVQLWRAAVEGSSTARAVLSWLGDGQDLSMVASALNLDPLAHHEPDRGWSLVNKTGSDAGVRVDVGIVSRRGSATAYAVLANWRPSDPSDHVRDEVLTLMRNVGDLIKSDLS